MLPEEVESFLTCPFLTTGLSKTPCMPKMADCGMLMMGVPNMEPKTPPLEMVKVPPSMSSTANCSGRTNENELKL